MYKETKQLVDRSQWVPGPWDSEDFDRADWTDKSSGFACYIKRNIMGAWCGYVVVHVSAEQRTWNSWAWLCFLESPTDEARIVSVHGGVTYARRQDKNDDTSPMVIGFDCCHCDDVYPRTLSFRPPSRCTPDSIIFDGYKNAEFAIRETTQLAAQLKGVSHAAT